MNDYQIIREWLISLLDREPKQFTPEVDALMQELWKKRQEVAGEWRMIINAFSAVLEYRAVEGQFTPYYLEKQDRVKAQWQKVLEQARALKEYVEKYVIEENQVLQVLGKVGAVIVGSHIVYTSGKHGTAYVNKDALYPHTADTSRLCRAIAERFVGDNVQVVIAPANGGVILSQCTAHHLTEMTGREVLGVYAEKEERVLVEPKPDVHESFFGVWVSPGEKLVIKKRKLIVGRGYDKLIAGKNVLVVEDVPTTGNTAKEVVEATRAIGGNVVGLGLLWNRGGITPQDVAGVPKLDALVNVKLDAWDEETCPLCERKVPINTEVGKGREFLARKQA